MERMQWLESQPPTNRHLYSTNRNGPWLAFLRALPLWDTISQRRTTTQRVYVQLQHQHIFPKSNRSSRLPHTMERICQPLYRRRAVCHICRCPQPVSKESCKSHCSFVCSHQCVSPVDDSHPPPGGSHWNVEMDTTTEVQSLWTHTMYGWYQWYYCSPIKETLLINLIVLH